MEKSVMRVAVACRNASGEADMPVFEVEVTDEEQQHGRHYKLAEELAADAGYDVPFLCFDHSEQSAIRLAAQTLKLVPSLVLIDNTDGSIHGVSCDDGQIDVVVYGHNTDDADEDLIDFLPIGEGGAQDAVWVVRHVAEPGEKAQCVADRERDLA